MRHYLNKSLEDLPGEVWKDVVGKEGQWQVSNLGRVKSLRRTVPTWNAYKTLPEMILSQRPRNGYTAVACEAVHRLVARAFLPTDDPSKHVNHKNGIRNDNRVENLEWCTAAENVQHAWATGLCNEDTRAKMSAKAKERTGNKNSCWRGVVEIRTLDGELLHQADDLGDAVEWVKANTKFAKASKGAISLACTGNRGIKKMYGLKFNYNKGGENA